MLRLLWLLQGAGPQLFGVLNILLGFAGSAYGPLLSSIASIAKLSPVGISLLAPTSLLPVMLASQFIALVVPTNKAKGSKEGMLEFGSHQVKENSIGHMMNNSLRGLLDYTVAAISADYMYSLLQSHSAISNPNLRWGIMIACGGTMAKLFDSYLYEPFMKDRIAYGSHKVGDLYAGFNDAIHTMIAM